MEGNWCGWKEVREKKKKFKTQVMKLQFQIGVLREMLGSLAFTLCLMWKNCCFPKITLAAIEMNMVWIRVACSGSAGN